MRSYEGMENELGDWGYNRDGKKGKKGNFDTNYNVQVACSEDQIISYCNVVTLGNDKAQLVPALQGIQANTGQNPGLFVWLL